MENTPEVAVLTLVKSCASVSYLINTEPLELLRLQPSELIASESVGSMYLYCVYGTVRCGHEAEGWIYLEIEEC